MNNIAADFSPLPATVSLPADAVQPDRSKWAPIVPVPDDVSGAFPHHRLGKPSAHWVYRDAAGHRLMVICRFDKPGEDKEILPLTWCRATDGREEWRWKGLDTPRPLYGLDRLAARPDADVLVCEGEKAADAATVLFPDWVVITSPNGAKSAAKADWSQLHGRRVTIWPDHDAGGENYAADVTQLAAAVGATSVRMVQVPADFPENWDLADAPPDRITQSDLQRLMVEAKTSAPAAPEAPKANGPVGFTMRIAGLFYQPEDPEKPAIKVAGYFDILAETRDDHGEAWGVLIRWHDNDSRLHEWAMPRAMLAGDGAEMRQRLLDGGLFVSPSPQARQLLMAYLGSFKTDARARCVASTGWHGGTFVTPGEVFGPAGGERLLLQTAGRVADFERKGTLEGWQNEVAKYAVGNSRLALALAVGFVGPLLRLLNEDSFGIHFTGKSSGGKTTALDAAASVWGVKRYTWRTTDNGAEGLATAANDGLLVLDELSQADGRAADAMAYLLGNGAGKARMRKDATTRPLQTWRLAFLSTGEIGLAEKLGEVGKTARAGQAVRLIEIPADAGAGHRLFETLHGFADGAALSRHLRDAAERHRGHAIRDYLKAVTRTPDDLAHELRAAVVDWVKANLPAGADGQVARVANRFGLLAAAGELATDLGLLPWPDGEAARAAAVCFRAWLDQRGGIGSAEASAAVNQVQAFIELHGMSRFAAIWEDGGGNETADDGKTINRAGYRRRCGDGWEYFVLSQAWKNEVCKGIDATAAAKELAGRNLLLPSRGGKASVVVKIPGQGSIRVYHLLPAIVAGGAE